MLYLSEMKILKRMLPFAIIVVVALLLVYLPDVVPERYTDLSTFFSNERLRQGFVGYSVASVRYGKPDLAAAWGTDARGVPLDSFAPMAIGELSGAVTGLLVLEAEYEKKIALDKGLGDYVPDPDLLRDPRASGNPVPKPSPGGPTIRELLSHTSGIDKADFDDRHAQAKNLETGVRGLARTPPRRAAGSSFEYLETGYQALGLALEKSYRLSFAELAASKVFKPLKMLQSGAEGGEAANRLPLGSTSFFWTPLPKTQDLPSFRAPSSGMVSTAPDFARLMAAIVSPGFDGSPLVSKTAMAKVLSPVSGSGGYSYGWQVIETKQGRELRIEAATEAFSAIATLWPERQAGVVIMAPESSLVISGISLPKLADGAREILFSDSTKPPLPLGRFFILLAVIASVHIIFLSTQTGNALSWARSARGRADAKGSSGPLLFARLRCALGLAVRFFLVLATPTLVAFLLGRDLDWGLLFDREPGLSGWFFAAISIGSLRNVARLSWLRGPSSQVKKMRLLLRK